MASFGISGVEPACCATTVSVIWLRRTFNDFRYLP